LKVARESAAIILQKHYRGMLARQELAYLKRLKLLIQRFHDEQMATRVQSYWRMILERRQFEQLKADRENAAIVLQKHYRALQARQELSYLKRLKLLIQRFHDEQEATRVQSYWRMVIEKRRITQLKAERESAAVTIQKHCRALLARRELARLRYIRQLLREQMATRVQSQWRMVLERRRFEQLKVDRENAAIVLQKHYRALQARQELAYLKRLKLLIQRFHDERMATKIQSYWRMVSERRRFLKFMATRQCAAIVLQKHCRALLARRELARLRRLNLLVLWFQCKSRGYLYRRKFDSSIEAVFKIRNRFRGENGITNLLPCTVDS
jgi:flagellar biosynthesis regulator FlbT